MIELSQIEEYLQHLSFKSNPNLRPVNSPIEYTEEMLDEYIKCSQDPIYFICKYVKVVHPDRGVVLMELYDYQKEMVDSYYHNRFSIVRTARQQGKTQTAAAFFVWYIIFNDNKSVAVLANKQATSDEILSRIRMSYENLPKWLQMGVKVFNRRSIELENGSKLFGAATSSSGIRGKTINLLYIDEMAFIQNTAFEEFFTSVYPTITASRDARVILTSTPNGFNHFYKFWSDAEKGINGFNPVRVHWYQTPGRDQKWFESQMAILGEQKGAQEILAEFMGSSRQLLSATTMATLTYDIPIKTYEGEFAGLKVYKTPEKERVYTMTVDVSRGRHLDASAFSIFDVTEYPHRVAATYKNNEVPPLMYAGICFNMAKNYNEAFILVEINDVGAQVADELFHTYEYENLYWTKSGDVLGKKGADPYPGIRTTKKTKRIGCANLKDIVERNQLIVNDADTITELSTFVQADSGTWEADDGFHDDMVATLWLFAWLVTQPWFVDLTDRSMRNKMYLAKEKEMEDSLTPFGFIQDGLSDELEEVNLNW